MFGWHAVVQKSQDHTLLQMLSLKYEVLSNSLKLKSNLKPFFRFLSFSFRVCVKVLQAILVKHVALIKTKMIMNETFSSGNSEKPCDEPGKRSIYSGVGLGDVGWELRNS